MKKLLAVVAVAALGFSAVARAEDTTGTGLSVSARLGYAFPMGSLGDNVDTSKVVDGNIPLGVELDYRFMKNVEAGAYLEYGWGREATGVTASVTTLRIGGELNYLLAPDAMLVPWVGVGAGWTRMKAGLGGTDDSISGYDFTVQGGAQYKIIPAFSVGPFAALTVGRFTDSKITDKAWHEWLQIGLRGTLAF